MKRMGFVVTLLAVLASLNGCPFGAPYRLNVVPEEIKDSIPGQRCVFLATVEPRDANAPLTGPVTIDAHAKNATVLVENPTIMPGDVAEITIIPDPLEDALKQSTDDEGRNVYLTIDGTLGDAHQAVWAPVHVTSEEEDTVQDYAIEVRDMFIPWLAENHPELGITAETEWTPTIVTPHILIVTHYLFFSEAWEMHVYWHVMIPPYDWAYIELRHRFDETLPSLAFKIESRQADPPVAPVAVEPSDTLWR